VLSEQKKKKKEKKENIDFMPRPIMIFLQPFSDYFDSVNLK